MDFSASCSCGPASEVALSVPFIDFARRREPSWPPLVEPAGGLPKADKEFYVVQSELYADEEDGKLIYSSAKADAETPTFMFFNGALDALMESNALKAKVGDVVRLYIGNAGPNKISSFHVIGEIFDHVWREADLVSPPARSVQTTLIPAGGATVLDFLVDQPATYLLVDHAINRIHIGLIGSLVVSQTGNCSRSSRSLEAVIHPEPHRRHQHAMRFHEQSVQPQRRS